jgi:(p)ppGpp synthase/HD superfamily hydrolase
MAYGYSDAINHAFAFAAKHHDRQVRKGTKLPYLTHPANVALILARYDQDEETIIAGILHDVIEDCVVEGLPREALEERIGSKFGQPVLEAVLSVTYRKYDDEGVELSSDERKEDYLTRLSAANERALWVCAADKIHNASSILADLRRTVDEDNIWRRFGAGKAGTIKWYRDVYNRLLDVGFNKTIVDELGEAVKRLEQYA